jgi:uncharacterized membrane protein YkoI
MKRNHKIIVAVVLIMCGIALIGWNFRDPDAAYREQPQVETAMTLQQTPAAIQTAIQRLMKAGDRVDEIKEEREGSEVKYEVEIISGNTKTEYELSPDGTILEQKSKTIKP